MNFSSNEGEIPIPITSTFLFGGGAHCQSQSNCIGPPPPPPPPPETPTPLSLPTQDNSKKGVLVKYRECLKNHAASIGGNATDGCGEFMPSGKEGTLEALKCSACHCHRNFHRKETEGISSSSCDCFQFKGGRKMMEGYITRPSPHHMIMPLGAIQTSESDEMEGYMTRTPIVKKRFRTKFSAEQKEKMLGFAEKMGWRLQKQEESLVQQFCQEIGIKRRVLKVWMHNNKHNLAKKTRNLQLDWSTSTTTVTDL